LLAKKIYIEDINYPKKSLLKKKPGKKIEESDFPVGLSLFLIIVSIFLTILVVHQSTQLMKKQYYLCDLMETRKSLEQQNLKLINDFNSLQSLERIENIAAKEFKMARPDFENVFFVEEIKDNNSVEKLEPDSVSSLQ